MPSDKSLYEFLNDNASKNHVSFHMPGHKSRREIYTKYGYADLLDKAIEFDITEIPGADALYHPMSVIKTVMDNYADLYGVLHTELLVGGSSAGVMAAILSSVPVGGKLILGRNSHHSAFSAMRLGSINPVYVQPETDEKYNLSAEISPYALEEACKAHPDASAVLITSPNYCGMLSDISVLTDIAHDYGMILIADQAHGAHLRFFDYNAKAARESGEFIPHIYHSAESLGADISICSTHKTLLSFTGSAILNICGDSIDISSVSDTLRMLQTTSPSYILMAGLDVNEKIMREHGAELISSWKSDLDFFYRNAGGISGLTVVQGSDIIDESKINISMAQLGLSGERLERELRHRGIISEMVHGNHVLLMSGIGNKRSDYERLLDALLEISSDYGVGRIEKEAPCPVEPPVPESSYVPAEFETLPLYQSDGRIMYDPIISYPPGTPLICPGEIMNPDIIAHISELLKSGDSISGVDEEGFVRVGL